MPSEITVMNDPVIVYSMIGVLVGSVLLALFFSRPRRGLGAATKSDAANVAHTGDQWMPGGDVFGREPEPPAATSDPEPAFADPFGLPAADPAAVPPATHDPWSAIDQPDQQAPWERR